MFLFRVAAGPFGPARRSAVIDHHVPDGRVVFQCVDRHVLAVAGLLQAAMRHLVDEHEVGVDPGAAILQAGAAVFMPRLMSLVQTDEARP